MQNFNINPEALIRIPGQVWVYWKDIKGKYLGCNDLMADSLNLSSRLDIAGMSDYDLPILKNESDFYRTADSNVMTHRITKQFQDSATLSDGKINFIVIKSPLLENDNKLVGLIGISYYLDRKLAIEYSDKITFPRQINSHPITQREIEVLRILIRGKTAKEIARCLNLSPRTVEHYLENIKFKLGAASKSELIEMILEHCQFI